MQVFKNSISHHLLWQAPGGLITKWRRIPSDKMETQKGTQRSKPRAQQISGTKHSLSRGKGHPQKTQQETEDITCRDSADVLKIMVT